MLLSTGHKTISPIMPLKRSDFKQCAVIAGMRSGLPPTYFKEPQHEIFGSGVSMQSKLLWTGDLGTLKKLTKF
jgi:hypothetical protein